MSDPFLPNSAVKERVSVAYVSALAALARLSTYRPEPDFDSVDMGIQSRGNFRGTFEIQLKATTRLGAPDATGLYHFGISKKNHDDLIQTMIQIPRILVVLDLPETQSEWGEVTVDGLILRKRAYWVNLKGEPESDNVRKVTVKIPDNNIFDLHAIGRLIKKARFGELPYD